MSFVIEGKDGQKMAVTNRNMARALATKYSIQADATIDLQQAWTVEDTQTPTGAGDYFFYLLNGGPRDLVITRINGFAASAETVTLQSVTGTAVGGADFLPANRTVGSNRQPLAGVVAQTGVNITGLTPINDYERLHIPAGGEQQKELIERPLLIRSGSAVALVATTGAIAIQYDVDFMAQVIEVVEVL